MDPPLMTDPNPPPRVSIIAEKALRIYVKASVDESQGIKTTGLKIRSQVTTN